MKRFAVTFSTILAVLTSVLPSVAAAQIGVTTDIITGTVMRLEGGLPLEGAEVAVQSLETGITRRTRTNDEGKYTVLFPDGGGQYTVTVRALGLAPRTQEINRLADEDRLVLNFVLATNPTVLSGVTIRARQNIGRDDDRPAPGSVERAIDTDQAARLPIDASDLIELALLAPGVVSIPGTDTSAAQFSVGGLSPDANNITLDGMSFGSSQIPQEALRTTRVQTSTFDVSRGQFSGGLISSTTRGGTNNVQGNFTYSLRDRDLSFEGDDPSPAATGYTQNQFSGGFGGPIVRDKLFAFGSLQLRRRNDVVTSLGNSDALTLSRFGVSPDSVDRFADILSAHGVAPFGILADDRTADRYSAMLRLDYLTDGGHSITLRGDWNTSDSDPSRIGPLSLPQTGGNNKSNGGGIMATVTSNFGGRFLNELKIYGSVDRDEGWPFLTIPAGRVEVSSQLENETSISTLSFGGNTGLPDNGRRKSLEATNELSWVAGPHRLKLGALINTQTFKEDETSNRWGTYTFNSLEDFEAGIPASFTRTLTPRLREGQGTNVNLYIGDTWRVNRGLQLTLGARGEGSFFGSRPDYNPDIEAKFGYRTDKVPGDVRLTPRVGFTWTIGMPEQGRFGTPLLTLRGGIGEFRSAPSTRLVANAAGATGLPDNESQLICIGSNIPTPQWGAFAADPSAIPTSCLDGGNEFVPTSRPNVRVFGDDFGASRSWRSTLGASRRIFERYNLGVDFSYSRGVAQTGYFDANLATTPQFALADEAGRPVFVPASTIAPLTGATTVLASRLHQEYGQVLVTRSDLASDSREVTFSFRGFTGGGTNFNLSYTHSRGKDQGSGSFGGATTSGNPNVLEWSRSGWERRHSFNATVNYPVNLGLEITAFGRLSSGSQFTPMVSADINGDGARNDRAFLFDPTLTSDTALAGGMSRLLANAPDRVRSCLSSQLGAIAARNSCTGTWRPSLELQVNWRPNFLGLERRLALSFSTVNFLGGLDQLLHGENGLHGWGQYRGQENTLLYVRGFDQVNNRYIYEVNERFGATRNGANGISVPFQIGLQARYTLGPDRRRQMVEGMIRSRRGGGGGGRGGSGGNNMPAAGQSEGAGAASRFTAFNPVARILELRDSLKLTNDQVAQLQPLADSVAKRNTELGAEVQRSMRDAGANPDMGAITRAMQPKLEELRRENEEILKRIQTILTPAQWEQLPQSLRNGGRGPMRRPGPGQRPPGI